MLDRCDNQLRHRTIFTEIQRSAHETRSSVLGRRERKPTLPTDTNDKAVEDGECLLFCQHRVQGWLAFILASDCGFVIFEAVRTGGWDPCHPDDTVYAYDLKHSTDAPFFLSQAKAKAAPPSSSSGGKSAKKKKWSKGKVKDKAQHAVTLDKPTYDRILKEVPTFRFISQSILIERLKVNGSLARVAIRHLEKEGQIKRIVHHHGQLIYTRSIASTD
ncbi:hypothetical protein EVG20_g9409 [Dentipellis fragilis]|uniref:40S ribosomal protein S25 n=1 Tax=Dentipellis fragilis TaxID=205917 RepID=A0A4Y9XZG3_9AGAM|nr:hypothetical protein EVG20_g9409 [Dentipellis fragilis]